MLNRTVLFFLCFIGYGQVNAAALCRGDVPVSIDVSKYPIAFYLPTLNIGEKFMMVHPVLAPDFDDATVFLEVVSVTERNGEFAVIAKYEFDMNGVVLFTLRKAFDGTIILSNFRGFESVTANSVGSFGPSELHCTQDPATSS